MSRQPSAVRRQSGVLRLQQEGENSGIFEFWCISWEGSVPDFGSGLSGQVCGDAGVVCHGCSFVFCSAIVLCCVGLGVRGVPRIFVGCLRDLCVCFVRSFWVFLRFADMRHGRAGGVFWYYALVDIGAG